MFKLPFFKGKNQKGQGDEKNQQNTFSNRQTSTYTVSRLDLRRAMSSVSIPEKDIASILSYIEKMHRHITIINFINMLEKEGFERDTINLLLQKLGIDTATIIKSFNIIDEQRINTKLGKVYEITLDLSNGKAQN
ncbi:MAG: hypothetical protein ACP5RP_00960 [Candidatus Micrarchaeia archaeon]